MHGFALSFLCLALATDPVELPSDTKEIQMRRFVMPFAINPDRKDAILRVRLFVSENRGKTWEHVKDYEPSDKQANFTAERDGHFWFALQVELKDGKREPEEKGALIPAIKVYVNTEREALKVPKSNEELQHEIEELRKTVEQLRQKVKELEAGRKPK